MLTNTGGSNPELGFVNIIIYMFQEWKLRIQSTQKKNQLSIFYSIAMKKKTMCILKMVGALLSHINLQKSPKKVIKFRFMIFSDSFQKHLHNIFSFVCLTYFALLYLLHKKEFCKHCLFENFQDI